MREASDFSLGFLDPYPIRHYIHFYVTYLHALMQVDHHSFFLSICLLLSLFYSSISLYLIWFLFFLILLDVWLRLNIHTLYLLIWYGHFFIIIFHVGILRSTTHDVFYALHLMHEGYEDYIIGIFEPSFLSFFFHLITLAYVTSHVLRPP